MQIDLQFSKIHYLKIQTSDQTTHSPSDYVNLLYLSSYSSTSHPKTTQIGQLSHLCITQILFTFLGQLNVILPKKDLFSTKFHLYISYNRTREKVKIRPMKPENNFFFSKNWPKIQKIDRKLKKLPKILQTNKKPKKYRIQVQKTRKQQPK